jgi:hypothetical protein
VGTQVLSLSWKLNPRTSPRLDPSTTSLAPRQTVPSQDAPHASDVAVGILNVTPHDEMCWPLAPTLRLGSNVVTGEVNRNLILRDS